MFGSDLVIDRPVTKVGGSQGIVDLMMSRVVPQNHSDEIEHLIVELKAPTVKVGSKEVTQIEQYAYAVARDERFRTFKARWSFWVVSNDLDDFARLRTRQKDKPRGQISQTEENHLLVEVWVKTWAEILSECNSRLRFIRERLEYNVDTNVSLSYLQRTYEKYLSGVNVEEVGVTNEDIDDLESSASEAPADFPPASAFNESTDAAKD